jgi:hypothetical protein
VSNSPTGKTGCVASVQVLAIDPSLRRFDGVILGLPWST